MTFIGVVRRYLHAVDEATSVEASCEYGVFRELPWDLYSYTSCGKTLLDHYSDYELDLDDLWSTL